jgi:hypothetical protein
MLSRFAQVSTTALIALVLAGAARADTIKGFVVKGTAENTSGMDLGSCEENSVCSFSGTMMVDVTSSTMFPHGRVTQIRRILTIEKRSRGPSEAGEKVVVLLRASQHSWCNKARNASIATKRKNRL